MAWWSLIALAGGGFGILVPRLSVKACAAEAMALASLMMLAELPSELGIASKLLERHALFFVVGYALTRVVAETLRQPAPELGEVPPIPSCAISLWPIAAFGSTALSGMDFSMALLLSAAAWEGRKRRWVLPFGALLMATTTAFVATR